MSISGCSPWFTCIRQHPGTRQSCPVGRRGGCSRMEVEKSPAGAGRRGGTLHAQRGVIWPVATPALASVRFSGVCRCCGDCADARNFIGHWPPTCALVPALPACLQGAFGSQLPRRRSLPAAPWPSQEQEREGRRQAPCLHLHAPPYVKAVGCRLDRMLAICRWGWATCRDPPLCAPLDRRALAVG